MGGRGAGAGGGGCSQLSNSLTAATRVKDAVCDRLRDARRPKPPRPEFADDADVPLVLSVYR